MISNEEYQKLIAPKISILSQLSIEALNLYRDIIGRSLFKEDLYFGASANRCINLIHGFISMLESRNLTCVGILLRMQMDNCMRTYAAFIAEDKEDVISCIINGDRVDKKKDKNGIRLTDGHLKDELTKLDPFFSQVYDNASGYVHLSDKAFYQMVESCEGNTINFLAGPNLLERHNSVLLEAADAFVHFVHLHFKMLLSVAESKQHVDAELDMTESSIDDTL